MGRAVQHKERTLLGEGQRHGMRKTVGDDGLQPRKLLGFAQTEDSGTGSIGNHDVALVIEGHGGGGDLGREREAQPEGVHLADELHGRAEHLHRGAAAGQALPLPAPQHPDAASLGCAPRQEDERAERDIEGLLGIRQSGIGNRDSGWRVFCRGQCAACREQHVEKILRCARDDNETSLSS